jgi:hypothetical protein
MIGRAVSLRINLTTALADKRGCYPPFYLSQTSYARGQDPTSHPTRCSALTATTVDTG